MDIKFCQVTGVHYKPNELVEYYKSIPREKLANYIKIFFKGILKANIAAAKTHDGDTSVEVDTIETIYNQLVKNIDSDLNSESTENLAKAVIIIDLIHALPNSEAQLEFLKGGHFIIQDDGALYDALSSLGYQRISSHHGDDKLASDIGIEAGEIFSQLLIGKKKGYTWMQTENSPMPSIYDLTSPEAIGKLISHTGDFLLYIASLKQLNIGQYGISKHVDSKPILLDEGIQVDHINKFVTPEETLAVTFHTAHIPIAYLNSMVDSILTDDSSNIETIGISIVDDH